MIFQIYRETISGSRETFFDIEYWIDDVVQVEHIKNPVPVR